jgi:hypothetical protein
MTVVYKIDMLQGDATNLTGAIINQIPSAYASFVRFIRLCEGAGLCTVVASNYGEGPSPEGDGENYFDVGAGAAAAAVGENGWNYSEWNQGGTIMGLLIQFSQEGSIFGDAPGNPALSSNQTVDALAWAMGVREDGASPWNGGPQLTGTNESSTVNTSSNNTLRIRDGGGDAYTVINVTAGASTSKATIRNDLNTAFAGTSWTASTPNNNRLQIQTDHDGGNLDIDTIANGCTLSTAVGFIDGVTYTPATPGRQGKGLPVWRDGGSTCHAFPMSNNPGHAHAASRQNMARIFPTGSAGARVRWHLVANENGIICTVESPWQHFVTRQRAVGRYRPAAGMEAKLTLPYFMLNDEETSGWFAIGTANPYGDSNGTNITQQGGILGDPAQGVTPGVVSYSDSQAYLAEAQPNFFDSKVRHDMMAMMMFQISSLRRDQKGFLGFADSELFANVFHYPPGLTNDLADRATLGSATRPDVLHAFPWDGGPPPGTLKDREGRETII